MSCNVAVQLACLIFAGASTVVSAQTCIVSDAKREFISRLLCGQVAPETEYRFSGPDCAARSIGARLDDTAAQLIALNACGEYELAGELRLANVTAFDFMSTLSVCHSESVDVGKNIDSAMERLFVLHGEPHCNSSLRSMIDGRRAFFDEMIRVTNTPDFLGAIYNKLGVRVDEDGNVTE